MDKNIDKLLGSGFESFEKTVFRQFCDLALLYTKTVLEELDEYIKENRDKKRFKIKQSRKTIIKTVYGDCEYVRRMYWDTEKERYCYLLDDEMQIEKIGNISSNMCKKIVETTTRLSYRKTSETITELTGESISSHTAWDIVQKMGREIQKEEKQYIEEMNTMNQQGKEQVPVLFTEADGVWLNIQENKKKAKSQEMKLATIYTGWNEAGNQLVGKTVIAGMENGRDFNEKVEALVQNKYDTEKSIRVLNGDGASWIKNVLDSNIIFQLDKFHIYKKINEKIKDKNIAQLIRRDIIDKEYDKAFKHIEAYINSVDEKNEIKDAKELYKYLANNIEGLPRWQEQVTELPQAPEGVTYKGMGVQENQNCTLITRRMKRGRMRWSCSGANNMAKLICKLENGEIDKIFEIDAEITNNITQRLGTVFIPKKVGSGNKWMESIQSHIPYLFSKQSYVRDLLYSISE